jgi:hypothetical protein
MTKWTKCHIDEMTSHYRALRHYADPWQLLAWPKTKAFQDKWTKCLVDKMTTPLAQPRHFILQHQ